MRTPPSSTFIKEPLLALFLLIFVSCTTQQEYQKTELPTDQPYLVVLGVAQDAGYPQTGRQDEWEQVKSGARKIEHVVSLGLVDPISKQRWLFEATPDFNIQLSKMDEFSETERYPYDGIFLTHGHMGHYTGLMHIGREAMGASEVPVYAMPRMAEFLTNNGPWSQLVNLKNISLMDTQADQKIVLNERLAVTPFLVPHRDEYTETVGFLIESAKKRVIFIPDIDKWHKWDRDIRELVKSVDAALLDAAFFDSKENPFRDMSEIPHPFVVESMELFKDLSAEDKAKVHFIHFNHTNALLKSSGPEHQQVVDNGFRVARDGQVFMF